MVGWMQFKLVVLFDNKVIIYRLFWKSSIIVTRKNKETGEISSLNLFHDSKLFESVNNIKTDLVSNLFNFFVFRKGTNLFAKIGYHFYGVSTAKCLFLA